MMDDAQRTDTLTSLHTALVDSRNGYQEALADAGPRGLDGLFREMIELRRRNIEELAGLIRSLGRQPDREGSFMSTVHRTVIKVRALFSELDERILPGLIDGEKRILGYYDEAVDAAAGLPYRGTLERQRLELEQKIQRMESMRAASR